MCFIKYASKHAVVMETCFKCMSCAQVRKHSKSVKRRLNLLFLLLNHSKDRDLFNF